MSNTINPYGLEEKALFAFYDKMRRKEPFVYDDRHSLHSVFTYETARVVLMNPSLFSSNLLHLSTPRIESDTLFDSLALKDHEVHRSLRMGVQTCFAARVMEMQKYTWQHLLETRWNTLEVQAECDILQSLIRPFATECILTLLGVPPEDWTWFREWWEPFTLRRNRQRKHLVSRAPLPYREQMCGSPLWNEEIEVYFKRLLEDRFFSPRPDLLGALAAIRIDSQPLTLREMLNNVKLMLVASQDATVFLITNTLHCLFHTQEMLGRPGDCVETLLAFIAEAGRLYSPVQGISRVVTRDALIQNCTLREGQEVIVWLGAANRDPSAFDMPNTFLIDRKGNLPLSYGAGVHFCPGMMMAQKIAGLFLQDILRRFPYCTLHPTSAPERCENPFLFGFETFPLQWNRDLA